jgi:hypothetical protein
MADSPVFKTIIDKPTPQPRATRPPRTPIPPTDFKKVLDKEGWRLADVYKGKITIERTKRKDAPWLEMKVGDKAQIAFSARETATIELIAIDEGAYKATLKYSHEVKDQTLVLSMF